MNSCEIYIVLFILFQQMRCIAANASFGQNVDIIKKHKIIDDYQPQKLLSKQMKLAFKHQIWNKCIVLN